MTSLSWGTKWYILSFTVLAMESQAEALNQLTTDDLEGKVTVLIFSSIVNYILLHIASLFWKKKILFLIMYYEISICDWLKRSGRPFPVSNLNQEVVLNVFPYHKERKIFHSAFSTWGQSRCSYFNKVAIAIDSHISYTKNMFVCIIWHLLYYVPINLGLNAWNAEALVKENVLK